MTTKFKIILETLAKAEEGKTILKIARLNAVYQCVLLKKNLAAKEGKITVKSIPDDPYDFATPPIFDIDLLDTNLITMEITD